MSLNDYLTDFPTFNAHMFSLYQETKYAEALELCKQAQKRFPDNAPIIYYYSACMAGRLNDSDQTFGFFRTAHDQGYWYSSLYWEDADFDLVRDLPEFARLRAISEQRHAEAQARAKPEVFVQQPKNGAAPYPLLMALHGNMSSAARHVINWQAAQQNGWLVAMIQSSQITGPDMYIWDDRDLAEKELRDHLTTLCAAHPIDGERVVIGGFSMGAETAIYLALKGSLPVRGFIAIAPGGPFMREMEQWAPLIEGARGRNLRGYIFYGGQDVHYNETKTLVEQLRAAGIDCRFEDDPDLAHAFPSDFADRLPGILDFVLGRA